MTHIFNGKGNSHIPLHPHCQRRLYCWHYNLFSFHHALEQEGNLKNEKKTHVINISILFHGMCVNNC